MRRSEERIFDEFLAASARAGDRSSFERLAKRWQPKLLGHAYRLTGEAEFARDVVQDAWTDIARGLSRLDDAAAFPAWAYRIVSRRAADSIRKKQRERSKMNAYATEPEKADGQAAQMEFKADGGPLGEAMNALPPEQRAAIALFYKEDFSIAEIAAALSVPAGTVKTRLMHARRKLRAALEGESENERS
ncbi:MAG: sigma-70 family RNA polymerase sigma factor [Marinicaulis sp.]|nr:sigma-70 family RNA polymerase sigma factor [Marinicaulis sp.]NNE39587.1 sigma-70 family RNA polymerase sigma factor [Marinicaulis sp.]NNL88465.1 sigma-70 family RNA polymerase sigma factor [Marinicaulis sp.]